MKITIPPTENGFIPTLNKMGYMSTTLDCIGQQFVKFAGSISHPAVDIGAAYGIATIAALKEGSTLIYANDIEKGHLDILYSRAPDSLRTRLELVPGNFPTGIDFPKSTIGAILISKVLHFFSGPQIHSALSVVYSWLIPGGKVFITAESPYVRNAKNFIPIYEERCARNESWPGFVEDIRLLSPKRYKALPKSMNFLDPNVLTRTLEEVGFVVEGASFFPREDYPKDSKLDCREGVGVIAEKK